MTQEQAQSIGQIIDRFDFQTVHDYMVLTGWKWFDEVPTMDNLKGTATRLLVEAQMDPQEVVSMGTGGFRVYKLPWGLELVFAMKRSGTF
jgi:hypothetical protein